MAKSGGVLNAICAKLLKGNLSPPDTSPNPRDGSPGKGGSPVSNVNGLVDEECPLVANSPHAVCERDLDTDKENNNTTFKDIHSVAESALFDITEDRGNETPVLPTTAPSSEGRRNRRKNVKPRNIVEYRDLGEEELGKDESELDAFEINNRDVDFDELYNVNEMCDDEEEPAIDLSNTNQCDSFVAKETTQEYDSADDCPEFDHDNGVLDLSVSRSDHDAHTHAKTNTPTLSNKPVGGESTTLVEARDSTDGGKRPNVVEGSTGGKCGGGRPSGEGGRQMSEGAAAPTGDAAAIKDYAQSTVTELLGMYGLSDEAEDITQSVPLQNFSTRHILQHHTEPQAAHQKHKQLHPKRFQNHPFPLAVKHLASKSSAHPHHAAPRLHGPPHAASRLERVQLSSSSPRTPNEGMYAKIVDSVAKMAKMPHGKGSLVSKFATSSEYVKACFNPAIAPKLAAVAAAAATGGKALLPDYSKYIKRFSSYDHCGGAQCRDMAYKEHFHCMDCNFRVFVKKEEMIRHFKWHKKRDESLQHGFMRYSPVDDCSKKFGTCTHNGRQTHYHCLQASCNKVYISTSDVQMHANYHRKDSAIIQEGFQRFRATEDCGTQACSFYGQRTTHFHCRRPTCNFTFKNKADMEKHKAYHQKDELLGRDGFKKFMKYEHCKFQNCRYSKVANHIHCIRAGCEYVLHSTGQLYSHKRKHERRDFEHAYRRFKDEQKHKPNTPSTAVMPNPALNPLLNMSPGSIAMATSPGMLGRKIKQEAEYIDLEDLSKMDQSNVSSENSMGPTDLSMSSASSVATNPEVKSELNCSATASTSECIVSYSAGAAAPSDSGYEANVKPVPATLMAKMASTMTCSSSLSDSLNLPIASHVDEKPSAEGASEDQQPMDTDAVPQSPVSSVVALSGTPGVAGFIPKTSPPVNEKKEKDESWKKFLTRYTANDPCHPRCHFLYKDHYHCNLEGCGMIFRNKDGVREHARYHEQQDRITMLSFRAYNTGHACIEGCQMNGRGLHYHCLWADCNTVIRTTDPPFSRLEHHKIHEYARAALSRQPRTFNIMKINDQLKRRRGRPPKYPKTEIPIVPKIEMSEMEIADELRRCTDGSQNTLLAGFKKFAEQEACPDERCVFITKQHFHCVRPRCHHATDRADVLNLHAKDFHSYISILEGFEFFDRTVNCRRPHCHNNKANKHFHCVRARCDYSFVRYSTMAQHDKKHKMADMNKQMSQPKVAIPTKAFSMSPMMLHNAVITTNSPIAIRPPPPRGLPHQGAPPTEQDTNALQNIVKTSGTYFPLSALPGARHGPVATSSVSSTSPVPPGNISISITPPGVIHAASNAPVLLSGTPAICKTTNVVTIAPKPSASGQEAEHVGEVMPLTRLLQQPTQAMPQLNWLTMKMKMHYGVSQNCGRPFCKLKKKDHFHCFDCNQAFSDPARLKVHVSKHGMKVDRADNIQGALSVSPAPMSPTPITIAPISDEGEPDDEESAASDNLENDGESDNAGDDFNASSSLNLDARTFTRLIETGPPEYDSAVARLMESRPPQYDSLGASPATRLLQLAPPEYASPGMMPSAHNILDLSVPPARVAPDDREEEEEEEEGSGGEDEEEEIYEGEEKELGERAGEEKEELAMAVDYSGEAREVEKEAVDYSGEAREVEKEMEPRDEEGESSMSDDCSADPADPGSRGQSPTGSIEGSSRRSSRKRIATRHDDFVDSDVIVAKQRRLSGPKPSPSPTMKEEIVPEGYEKFRFSVDCNQQRCAYRLNLTHYHCLRAKCRYAFSDRTRAPQHTQKHERIDNITGDEFQQFRINQDCDRGDCEHSKKMSHFHCLKCPFICTDTTKVLAHRRHHMKLDSILSKGFEKVAGTTECTVQGCAYSLKQTHYHCQFPDCQHAVAGPAQMGPHQLKHVKS